jgi:hypothetical protein
MSATPSAYDSPNTNANVESKDYLYYAAVQRREEDLAMSPNSEIEKVEKSVSTSSRYPWTVGPFNAPFVISQTGWVPGTKFQLFSTFEFF